MARCDDCDKKFDPRKPLPVFDDVFCNAYIRMNYICNECACKFYEARRQAGTSKQ